MLIGSSSLQSSGFVTHLSPKLSFADKCVSKPELGHEENANFGTRLPQGTGRGLFPGMSTVLEIETAIEKLPTAQMLEIAAWLDEQRVMVQASEGMFAALDAEEGADAGRQWTGK